VHDAENCEGRAEVASAEVGGHEQFVVMGREGGAALGENAEDVGGDVDVAVAGGGGQRRHALA